MHHKNKSVDKLPTHGVHVIENQPRVFNSMQVSSYHQQINHSLALSVACLQDTW